MGWSAAGEGYEISLAEGRVVARSTSGRSAGRRLKTLPKALRDHAEVERLRRFAEWLDRHTAECAAQVDAWMVSALPVPSAVLGQVWEDEAWRAALRDLVVVGGDPETTGFLRDVSESGELGVVNLDGETVRSSAETVVFPHPVLLPDLDGLREFAAELGVTQKVEQIYRATWNKPSDPRSRSDATSEFAGGRYRSRFALVSRAESLGYRVSGGYVIHRLRDGGGRMVQAAVWVGEPHREDECETGGLGWRDPEGHHLPFDEIDAVAWSEGMRMAAALYAGRTGES
ncbi:DUF4132 domain-containing protein [Actinocorallia populi]|uniref:DUF4132 domain-containing protein n=1 Tax=Actinocorallia populi TaxID=2079200 RepID=UPI000D0892FC|nr:DUF4132 domain-containing protein [Actinocorallia populi]